MTDYNELFIAAVANIPRLQRPWGSITWLAERFAISRPTVYGLGKRIAERLQAPAGKAGCSLPEASSEPVGVTRERIERTVLTAAFPGKVALRPMQEVLQVACGETRRVGYLSELLTEAGKRAGQVLQSLDHSRLGPVIVVRDETFFGDWPKWMLRFRKIPGM